MTHPPVRVLLSGDGRMGAELRRLITAEAEPALVIADDLDGADVVLDYSHPDWTGPLLQRLLRTPRPTLVGTTGLGERLQGLARELSTRCPVLVAPNTGLGIPVLRALVRDAVRRLGPGWDAEVLELHHARKVDAPSGTAWALVEDVANTRATQDLPASEARAGAVAQRVGEVGARVRGEIGVQSLRGGDVVGEHTVYLIGHGERIELTHRAWDRATFARGGLRCARWLASPGLAAGWYSVEDVIRPVVGG